MKKVFVLLTLLIAGASVSANACNERIQDCSNVEKTNAECEEQVRLTNLNLNEGRAIILSYEDGSGESKSRVLHGSAYYGENNKTRDVILEAINTGNEVTIKGCTLISDVY